ncbi:MAG: aminoglycoside 6-adenylyltransferase [Lactobacillales bacterium]|jgi:aminoglycoside 6-adenylyltransferase|nr:aminoglycoside 6-adenylyltransferase [Lactobacillales bacterium]
MDKRTNEEMLELILNFAKTHSQIEVVGMEGSRANPNVSPDDFQDFDITYFVDTSEHLVQLKQENWEEAFGKTIISQEPENLFADYGFTKLMLFEDENRIDLKILLISDVEDYLESESLNTIIYGGESVETSEKSFLVNAPSEQEFYECVNEFYWVSTYIVKGLSRDQLLYANGMLEKVVRPELLKILSWKSFIGENAGKENYKLLEVYPELAELYKLGSVQETWQALIKMEKMFRKSLYSFDFPIPNEVEKTSEYIQKYFLMNQ